MARPRSRSRQPASTASLAPAADRKTRLAVPLLATAIVLVYANSLSTPFQFDDLGPIENGAVRESRPEVTATAQPSVQVAGRPIVRLSFALNYAWGGSDVTGYHVFNIAVHIVCTVLFFFLVRNEEANARLVTAVLHGKLGRSGEARDLLVELIARRSDYAPAYLALGDIYFQRSEFADAQQSYRRFLTYEPAHEAR